MCQLKCGGQASYLITVAGEQFWICEDCYRDYTMLQPLVINAIREVV